MEALSAKAALVDPAGLDDGPAITTVVPRAEIEQALQSEGPSDFYLDVKRSRDGESEEKRITITWEPGDLERVLDSASSENVALGFKADELARMFEEPDVEAQGLRERAAILTIATAAVAGTTAGAASGMVAVGDAGGPAAAPPTVSDIMSSGPNQEAPGGARFVTDTTSSGPAAEQPAGTQFVTDTTSSGPGPSETADTQFVTDTTSSGPGTTGEAASASEGTEFITDAMSSGPGPAQAASGAGGTQFITDATSSGPGPSETASAASGGGGGSSFFDSASGEATLAGGLMLLVLGAGFVATRQGGAPKPA